MKYFFINQRDIPAVESWLTENVGSKNVRWWWDYDRQGSQRKVGDKWIQGAVVWLDVTEEEAANLTWFAMRWS